MKKLKMGRIVRGIGALMLTWMMGARAQDRIIIPETNGLPETGTQEQSIDGAGAKDQQVGLSYDSNAEAGPHHTRKTVQLADGRQSSYTELATGLNVWDRQNHKWAEGAVQMEVFDGGAISRQTAWTGFGRRRRPIRREFSTFCSRMGRR
jgi:hypothetical protein